MEWLQIGNENKKGGEEGGGSEKRRRSGYICEPLITGRLASKFTSFCPRSDELKFGREGDGGYITRADTVYTADLCCLRVCALFGYG